MKVLFDLNHPAHVHLFKNFIKYLDNNYEYIITTRERDVVNVLLDHYKIKYVTLSEPTSSFVGMFFELLIKDLKIFFLHRKYKFTFAFGTSPSIAHLSMFTKVKSYNFNEDDDSVVPLYSYLTYPFTTKIINPDCIAYAKWKKKRVFYNSYHELAYLHPDNFIPDEGVLRRYSLEPGKYILIRNSALKAHHDKGAKGLNGSLWDRLYEVVKDYPLVSSIEGAPSHQIDPWDMHHVIAYAKLFISDSQTMTIEAAVLGTPSVRYSSFVGRSTVIDELEKKYELSFGYRPGEEDMFINKIKELLLRKDLSIEWGERRSAMLAEKCDLNAWMIKYFQSEADNS